MFSRLRYDTCASKAEFRDNVSIFSHTVDVDRFVHSEPCAHKVGLGQTNAASTVGPQPLPGNIHQAWGQMIAVENDLRGQTRHTSRCPSYKYIPKGDVIQNKNLFREEAPPLQTDGKEHLGECQMLDYTNLETAYKGFGEQQN
nr:hypothetical protein TetV2_00326 [Oceanusvirus sp.]